jgi:hypothetical protein
MRTERQEEAKPEPAVPVRRSIGSDHLVCLVCGKRQILLKRHLAVEHGLTPKQYRDTFKLKPDYPMTAPSYTQQRRELALKTGFGRPKKKERRRQKPTAAPWGLTPGPPWPQPHLWFNCSAPGRVSCLSARRFGRISVVGGLAVNSIISFLFFILVSGDWPLATLVVGYGLSVQCRRGRAAGGRA